MPSASFVTTYGITALAIIMGVLVIIGGRSRIVTLAIPAMMAIQFWLAASGILAHWERKPVPFVVMMLVTIVLTIALAFSAVGKKMMMTLPFAALIGAQAFRLPLELVMHHAASEGVMPIQMSYSGSNFDIVSGATAILVAILAANGSAPRWVLIAWNALGSILLLNIIVVAVLSAPLFAFYGQARLNTWVAYAPFVWLPGVLVPAALLGHLLLWRKLARF